MRPETERFRAEWGQIIPPPHLLKDGITIPVSLRALIARINRALKHEDQMLEITRGERWRASQGDYYIVDTKRNWMLHHHIDPEALGRELKVLAEHRTSGNR